MSAIVMPKPVSLVVSENSLMCDCHDLVWHVDDITSDDGRSLSCVATRNGITIETER